MTQRPHILISFTVQCNQRFLFYYQIVVFLYQDSQIINKITFKKYFIKIHLYLLLYSPNIIMANLHSSLKKSLSFILLKAACCIPFERRALILIFDKTIFFNCLFDLFQVLLCQLDCTSNNLYLKTIVISTTISYQKEQSTLFCNILFIKSITRTSRCSKMQKGGKQNKE